MKVQVSYSNNKIRNLYFLIEFMIAGNGIHSRLGWIKVVQLLYSVVTLHNPLQLCKKVIIYNSSLFFFYIVFDIHI